MYSTITIKKEEIDQIVKVLERFFEVLGGIYERNM
jgi:hypothetical protein